jgi:hypothetical protein
MARLWPLSVDWQTLRFGIEIEFVGGRPEELDLLPGWQLLPGEPQVDDDGGESGGELVPPPLAWGERAQIREMLARLRRMGARANFACGLHVHIGLEPWGEDAVIPLLDAALACQDALRALLRTPAHRMQFCPPVTAEMRRRFAAGDGPPALEFPGPPQSRRCGLNAKAWYDHGTAEVRYANGTLRYGEVLGTVELSLRLVAAVGRGTALPAAPEALARVLGVPARGYPPPQAAPHWYRERIWLQEALLPALGPLALARLTGEVLDIRPGPDGTIRVVVEDPEGRPYPPLAFRWEARGWVMA